MYGKNLLNRLTKGCHTIKESSWKLKNREAASAHYQLTGKQASLNLHVDAKLQRSSSSELLLPLSPTIKPKRPKRSKSVCSEKDTRKTKEKKPKEELPIIAPSFTDKHWITFITSPQYMNWLKIGLALRSVCEFVSPVVDEIVLSMHASLLEKHGVPNKSSLSPVKVNSYDQKRFDPMNKWMDEVLSLHRKPPKKIDVHRITNVRKWPTSDGAWEIARLFMSTNKYKGKDLGRSSSSCDVSSLLNFLQTCRLADEYVHDFQNVKRLLQVRNETMHNARLETDDETLDQSFERVLSLLHDPDLNKHVGKYMKPGDLIRQVEQSMRRALKRILIFHKVENPENIEGLAENGRNTIRKSEDKERKLFYDNHSNLSLQLVQPPKIEITKNTVKVESRPRNDEERRSTEASEKSISLVTKEENFPRSQVSSERIDGVFEDAKKQSFFAKTKSKKGNRLVKTNHKSLVPQKYPKKDTKFTLYPLLFVKSEKENKIYKNSFQSSKTKTNLNPVAFAEIGKAIKDELFPGKSYQKLAFNASAYHQKPGKTEQTTPFSLVPSLHVPMSAEKSKVAVSNESLSTNSTLNSNASQATTTTLNSFDSDVDNDQSVRLTSLVQGSLSFHSPADYMNELNNLYNTTSALSLVPAPMDFGVSAAAAMNRHLPSSASLYFVPSVSGTQTLKKATKRRIEDLQDPNHFETKMRKSGGSDKSSDFGEDSKSNQLIPLPARGSGGPGGGAFTFRAKLQNFLQKQPNNPGALFSIDKDEDGNHFCTASFQSNYAIYSGILSDTEEEAMSRAALEANRWLLGDYRFGDGLAARKWFDEYAIQVVGKKPVYRCSEVREDRFKTYVHLLNNRLFKDSAEDGETCRLFLQASLATRDPGLDIQNSVIKTALQEVTTPLESKSDNRKMLNEYCLENGGTIPVIHTAAVWHSKSEHMSWKGTLKSFISRSLSQGIEKLDMLDYESKRTTYIDGFALSRIFADFLTAESVQTQLTPLLAEESAAGDLLEKLGCPLKKVLEMQGSCKRHLEVYVYEMDYSVAYHTEQVTDKNKSPQYECVVSSACLYDTKTKFTVSSGKNGFPDEDSACEFVAKNALDLLGIETDFFL